MTDFGQSSLLNYYLHNSYVTNLSPGERLKHIGVHDIVSNRIYRMLIATGTNYTTH